MKCTFVALLLTLPLIGQAKNNACKVGIPLNGDDPLSSVFFDALKKVMQKESSRKIHVSTFYSPDKFLIDEDIVFNFDNESADFIVFKNKFLLPSPFTEKGGGIPADIATTTKTEQAIEDEMKKLGNKIEKFKDKKEPTLTEKDFEKLSKLILAQTNKLCDEAPQRKNLIAIEPIVLELPLLAATKSEINENLEDEKSTERAVAYCKSIGIDNIESMETRYIQSESTTSLSTVSGKLKTLVTIEKPEIENKFFVKIVCSSNAAQTPETAILESDMENNKETTTTPKRKAGKKSSSAVGL